MADVFTKKKRSQVMAAIRSTGNRATEVRLAAIFRAHGITGLRRHQALPGKLDFVFPQSLPGRLRGRLFLSTDWELTYRDKYNIFVAHEDSYRSTIAA